MTRGQRWFSGRRPAPTVETGRRRRHLVQRHDARHEPRPRRAASASGSFRRWSRTSVRPSIVRSRSRQATRGCRQECTSLPLSGVDRRPQRRGRRRQLGQFVQHLRDAHPPRVGDQLTHLSGLEPEQVRAHPLVAQVRGRRQEEGLRVGRDQAVALRPGEAEAHRQLVPRERDEDQLPDLELPTPADLALVGARQGEPDPAYVVRGGHAADSKSAPTHWRPLGRPRSRSRRRSAVASRCQR